VSEAGAARSERADVVVIGGGLAGLATAAFLAEGGVEVLLLEARSALFDGASGRGAGLVTAGLIDAPHRLVGGLGEAQTAEVLRFSQENAALLDAAGVLDRTGVVHAAIGERESAVMAESVAVAERLGLPCELWEAARVNEALGGSGFGPGRFVPGDGHLDAAALRERLTARAVAAGARIETGSRVSGVSDAGEVQVVGSAGERVVASEMVVIAAGAGAAAAAPWFGDKVYPVRGQLIEVLAERGAAGWSIGWRAQMGYLYGGSSAAGGLLLGGARWATPHLEVGETDDTRISEAVDEKLRGVLARRFPRLVRAPGPDRRAGIMAFTCDGLPFVGGIPGQPRMLACLGFNARGFSLALRAARAVADAVLTGEAEGLPDCLRPGRMAV